MSRPDSVFATIRRLVPSDSTLAIGCSRERPPNLHPHQVRCTTKQKRAAGSVHGIFPLRCTSPWEKRSNATSGADGSTVPGFVAGVFLPPAARVRSADPFGYERSPSDAAELVGRLPYHRTPGSHRYRSDREAHDVENLAAQ